jgi:26 proteasome complex subunit DSS1
MAAQAQQPQVGGMLDDDDDFEEFDVSAFAQQQQSNSESARAAAEGDEAAQAWVDDWDDDALDDEFSKQLRVELEKAKLPPANAMQS